MIFSPELRLVFAALASLALGYGEINRYRGIMDDVLESSTDLILSKVC
jgi:hypothetical protein